jgi:hypothetical protein
VCAFQIFSTRLDEMNRNARRRARAELLLEAERADLYEAANTLGYDIVPVESPGMP